MNSLQKTVLLLGIFLIFLMIIFPPFQLIASGKTLNLGYGFLLSPPFIWNYKYAPPQRVYGSVNGTLLLVQFIGTLIIVGLAYLLAGSKKAE